MKNLPYLRACIKEGLRFMTPFSQNYRTTGRDTVLQGYQIPKDVNGFILKFVNKFNLFLSLTD